MGVLSKGTSISFCWLRDACNRRNRQRNGRTRNHIQPPKTNPFYIFDLGRNHLPLLTEPPSTRKAVPPLPRLLSKPGDFTQNSVIPKSSTKPQLRGTTGCSKSHAAAVEAAKYGEK